MKIKLGHPRIYKHGHKFDGTDYQKEYVARPCGSGWIKYRDDKAKVVYCGPKEFNSGDIVMVKDDSDV
jgi:hypothetical protein